MNISRAALVMLTLGTLFACSPESNVRFHEYRLRLIVNGSEGSREFAVVNRVRVGDKYNHAPGMSGMGSTCKADATAILVPVEMGSIIALLDPQSGSEPSWNSCQIGELALTKPISEYQTPRLIFVPNGGELKSAVELDWKDLKPYQINNVSISAAEVDYSSVSVVEINKDVSSIPEQFLKWGCTGKFEKRVITTSPPTCSSLVIRELP